MTHGVVSSGSSGGSSGPGSSGWDSLRLGHGHVERIRLVGQVDGFQLTQLLQRGLVDITQSPRVPSDGAFQQVAGESAVAERRTAGGAGQDGDEPVPGSGGDVVVGAARQLQEDRQQLLVGVVVELDGGPEPAGQPRVLRDEDDHRVRVAGHDQHQVVPLVLHLLDQGVHSLGAVLVAGQAVGLVDEQHAADGAGHDLGRLDRGLTQVAGHQLGAVDLDQLALAEQPESTVDAADQAGHRGLARAGVADEHQVPGDGR